MKLYVVNYYMGGTPMDSKTLGVFDSFDKAKESLLQNLKELDIPKGSIDTQDDFYVFWDMYDFWGGIEIQKLTLNN